MRYSLAQRNDSKRILYEEKIRIVEENIILYADKKCAPAYYSSLHLNDI